MLEKGSKTNDLGREWAEKWRGRGIGLGRETEYGHPEFPKDD
jgi:hypothetical protein